MPNTVIAVFTGRSIEHILSEGGSGSWKLDRSHAMRCKYLVCCRSGVEWVEGTEPHGSAFLVGLISDIVTSPEDKERWLIKISEFARVNIPNVWQGWRNPVRYIELDTLGIDASTLTFEPMPEVEQRSEKVVSFPLEDKENIRPLTIAEAKRGLALKFGVSEEKIEIIIRG